MGGRHYNEQLRQELMATGRQGERELLARRAVALRCARGEHYRTATVPAGLVGETPDGRVLPAGTRYCPFCGATIEATERAEARP